MATSSGEIGISSNVGFTVPRKLRVLVLISGALCLVISILYLLMLLYPQVTFTGYIHGYLSLVSYELRYNTNGEFLALANLDTVKTVAVATAGYVMVLIAVTLLALLYFKKNLFFSTPIIYGVSTSLVVTSGVLRYLSQAFSIDAGMLLSYANNGGVFKFRTLAGLIEYVGVTAEKTFAYDLLFTRPLIVLALLYILIALSTTSTMWIVYIYGKMYSPNRGRSARVDFAELHGKALSHMYMPAIAVIGAILTYTGASVFAYYPNQLTVDPTSPPSTLDPPQYTYTCTRLTRTSRSVVTHTDFETYPVSGWASAGGTWSSVGGVAGAKGNVLRGVDNDRGVGGESQYYYNMDLSAYPSLWVAVKTRWASGSGNQYYGIGMMNSARNRIIVVEIFTTGTTTGYLDIWSYNVAVRNDWSRHARVSIPNYNQANWYIIVVYYSVSGTTISMTAYLYDGSGNYITTASTSITNAYTPAYIGVTVDYTTTGGSITAYFDDFIISTADPRSISFTGFTAGMRVEVWDNLGNLVNSTTAPAPSFYLNVTSDVVVGTGADGRIVVNYPDNFLCGAFSVPTADAILGGDSYGLATYPISLFPGTNRTSANVTVYISSTATFNTTARFLDVTTVQRLYARLILDNISAPNTLNLDLWVIGLATSTNISIRNGVPALTSTSVVELRVGAGGNLALAGHFTTSGQVATLSLKLELCTAPGSAGACVYYPIVLEVKS